MTRLTGDPVRAIELAKRSLRGNSLHKYVAAPCHSARGLTGEIAGARKTAARLLQIAPTLMVNRYVIRAPAGGLVTGTLWAPALRTGELLCQRALLPR
jgi:hypothetical protein